MKKIVVRSIMLCMFACIGQLLGSEIQDDLTAFKNLFFIRDKPQVSLFCYFPKNEEQSNVSMMYVNLMPEKVDWVNSQAIFAQENFDEVKKAMDQLYTDYINKDSSLQKQYQLCKQLMSYIQLACAVSYNVFKGIKGNEGFKSDFTDHKGFTNKLAPELEKIYNAVQSLVPLIKDLKGSAWSRLTNKFGKKSDGELALQTIKEALLKRAKELVHSYNNDIKKLTTKEIKFKPVKV